MRFLSLLVIASVLTVLVLAGSTFGRWSPGPDGTYRSFDLGIHTPAASTATPADRLHPSILARVALAGGALETKELVAAIGDPPGMETTKDIPTPTTNTGTTPPTPTPVHPTRFSAAKKLRLAQRRTAAAAAAAPLPLPSGASVPQGHPKPCFKDC